MNQKKITIIAVLAVILVLGFLGWQMWRDAQLGEKVRLNDETLQEEATKLNPFVQEAVNPFEESTNPYENIKTNPFE